MRCVVIVALAFLLDSSSVAAPAPQANSKLAQRVPGRCVAPDEGWLTQVRWRERLKHVHGVPDDFRPVNVIQFDHAGNIWWSFQRISQKAFANGLRQSAELVPMAAIDIEHDARNDCAILIKLRAQVDAVMHCRDNPGVCRDNFRGY
jgi:hypothetical protein